MELVPGHGAWIMVDFLDRPTEPSDKSRGVALALAALLGPVGAHRFYAGKVGTGLLMLCTLGGAGIWYLYDLIVVAGGSFRDAEGRLVSRWDSEQPTAAPSHLPEVLDELSALRAEVAELAERLDFTERLLADSREDSQAGSALKR